MNVLMPAFASSPGNEIFTALPELPKQHFPGLTLSYVTRRARKKIRKILIERLLYVQLKLFLIFGSSHSFLVGRGSILKIIYPRCMEFLAVAHMDFLIVTYKNEPQDL